MLTIKNIRDLEKITSEIIWKTEHLDKINNDIRTEIIFLMIDFFRNQQSPNFSLNKKKLSFDENKFRIKIEERLKIM